jgi:hypothetical protein
MWVAAILPSEYWGVMASFVLPACLQEEEKKRRREAIRQSPRQALLLQ